MRKTIPTLIVILSTCLLLGGGLIIPFGNNGGVSFTLSYDVLRDDYSPFRDGWIYSVGYSFGF